MLCSILTLFPGAIQPYLDESILGIARRSGRLDLELVDFRRFATDRHHTVDDRPFGGGPGMVMMCQPLWDAVLDVEAADPHTRKRVLLTPQGVPLSQPLVEELASLPRLLLIAGHYEGIDERVIERLQPLEISIGDFVLSGGEIPALALIDAIVRLLPGALGDADSAQADSFSPTGPKRERLLDCPHYTRPQSWEGLEVPQVLVSGDHAKVAQWRLLQMIERTRNRRPDLLNEHRD